MGLDLAFCISPESHAGEFTCLICHCLIDLNATSTQPCSHAFCTSCIEPWLKMHQRCPTCNEDLSHSGAVGPLSQNEKLAYRVLRRIKVRCPFQDDCDWTGDYGDLQAHMTNDEHFISMFGKSAGPEGAVVQEKKSGDPTAPPKPQNTKQGNHHGVSVTYKEQGDARFQANNYVEAQDLYSKALNIFTLQPSLKSTSDGLYTSILANRAAARMMLRDFAGLISDCNEVLKIDKNYIKAAIRKNKALTEMGKFEEACAAIREFAAEATSPAIRDAVAAEVKRAEGLRSGWQQGQEQFRQKDFGRAKNSFNVLMRNTSAPKVVIASARSDLGLGLVDSATRLVLQVNRRHATPESLECGGIAMLLSGEFDKAMEYFKEAARMDPELESNKQELRRCRTMRDCMADARRKVFERDFAKAVELYEGVKAAYAELPRQSPLHATLHVEAAGAKLRMKDFAGCLKDCATCLYAKDDCATAWVYKAKALHGLGREEEALEDLRPLMSSWGAGHAAVRDAYEKAEFEVKKKNRTDYYKLFGLPTVCSEMEIKKQYKVKALELHPDKIVERTEAEQKKATAVFQLLGEGLEILTDPQKRALYDEGYDKEAIEERVAAANRAAHSQNHHRHHR